MWKDIKNIISTELLPFIKNYNGYLEPKVRTNKPGQNNSYYTSHWCLFCVGRELEIGVKLAISSSGISLVYDFPHDKFVVNKQESQSIDALGMPVQKIGCKEAIMKSDEELYEMIDSYHRSNTQTYEKLCNIVSNLNRRQDKGKKVTSTQMDNAADIGSSYPIEHPIPLNQILFGPPGTGKTFHTINKALEILEPNFTCTEENREEAVQKFNKHKEEGRIVFTTFHQSMSYEDFVEGIKPKTDNNNVVYEVIPGIFKNICDAAKENGKDPYVLIIDEINRGNIANIFGELITLIEEDRRLGKN